MTMPALNSRPRPIHGESFRGYLLRLAATNGFPTVSFIVQSGDIRFVIENSHLYTLSAVQIMAAMEPRLRLTAGSLKDHFDGESSLDLTENQRKQLYRSYGAICPACIQDKPYIPAVWDNAIHTVCQTHGQPLIDACPNCRSAISLNRGKLDTCPHCKQQYVACSDPLTPEGLTALLLLKNLTNGQLTQERLLSAINCMARPNDMVTPQAPLSQMKIAEVIKLQYQAAGLLYSQEFRSSYETWLAAKNSDLAALSEDLLTKPMNHFKHSNFLSTVDHDEYDKVPFKPADYLDEVPRVESNIVATAMAYHVPAASLRSWRTDKPHTRLSRIITSEDLAALFGLRVSDLSELVTSGILSALNTSMVPKRLRFDLDEVLPAFAELPLITKSEKLTDDFVTLGEFRPHLKYFCSSISDVWTLMRSNAVNAYTTSDYASIEFSKNDMYHALHRRAVELGKLATELHLSRWWLSTIPNAKRAQLEVGININTNGLEAKNEMYVSLKRMSYFMGVRIDKLRLHFIKDNIVPSYLATDNGKQLDLYRLCDELEDSARSILGSKICYPGYIREG
jgi:hypothetical protein